jgi:hypothetical protein
MAAHLAADAHYFCADGGRGWDCECVADIVAKATRAEMSFEA